MIRKQHPANHIARRAFVIYAKITIFYKSYVHLCDKLQGLIIINY